MGYNWVNPPLRKKVKRLQQGGQALLPMGHGRAYWMACMQVKTHPQQNDRQVRLMMRLSTPDVAVLDRLGDSGGHKRTNDIMEQAAQLQRDAAGPT